VKVWGEFA